MIVKKRQSDLLKSIGLLLVFLGMQIGTAIRNIVPSLNVVELIMILSVLLLIDFSGLKKIMMPKPLFAIFIIQILLFIVAINSQNSTSQLRFFHLYLIAFIIALSTNRSYIEFKSFGRILFWTSGLITYVVLFQATQGFSRLVLSFEGTSKLWLAQGGDPITMSRALGMNLVACMFYRKANKIEKYATILFVIGDIIGLFSFGNRSVIVCSFLLFLIWYFRYFCKKEYVKKIAITVCAVLLVIAVLWKVPYFTEKIQMLWNAMLRGVGTLFGFDINKIDDSAQTRVSILQEVNRLFDQNFIKNFFLGMGYKCRYIDRPVFQVFFDFGILGLLVYILYVIWIPLKCIYKQIRYNPVYNGAWIYIVYISVQSLFDQFLTGLPYYYFLWTPAIFLSFALVNYKQKLIDIGV